MSVASGESTAVKSSVWKSYHSEVIFSKLSPVESNFRNITCSYYSYFEAIVFSPAMGNVDFYRLTTVNISITWSLKQQDIFICRVVLWGNYHAKKLQKKILPQLVKKTSSYTNMPLEGNELNLSSVMKIVLCFANFKLGYASLIILRKWVFSRKSSTRP